MEPPHATADGAAVSPTNDRGPMATSRPLPVVAAALGLTVVDPPRAASQPVVIRGDASLAAPTLAARVALPWLVGAAVVIDLLLLVPVRAMEAAGAFQAMLVIVPIVAGLSIGPIGAAAIWLVWGEGTFFRRLMIHWAVAFGLLTSLLAGFAAITLTEISPDVDNVFQAALFLVGALPALSLAAQLPLWPLRIYFGWCVERPGESPTTGSQALSIQDMLAGTAVVAATLGVARAVSLSDAMGFVAPQLVMFAAVSFGMSLFIGIPATSCVLRTENLRRGLLMLGGYLLVGQLLVIGIPYAIRGDFPPMEMLFVALLFVFTLAATAAAPLFVLRSCGYRLMRPRDRR